MSIINGELISRCEDGKLVLIEAFLEDFGKFINAVDGFNDKAFIKPLVSKFDGLPSTLKLFVLNISHRIGKNNLLSWDSCHVTRAISGLDSILSSSQTFFVFYAKTDVLTAHVTNIMNQKF
jgi:hypothetical protein